MIRTLDLRQGFNAIFRDRQILIRSEQGTTHVHFRRSQQIILAGIFVGLFLWGSAATVASVNANLRIADQSQQIEDWELGYAGLIAEIRHQKGISVVDAEPEQGGRLTQRLLDRSSFLQREIDTLTEALSAVERRRDHLLAENTDLQDRVEGLQIELAIRDDERLAREAQIAELGITLSTANSSRDTLMTTQQSLRAEVTTLQQQLARTESWNETLNEQVDELTIAVQGAYNTVDHLARQRDSLRAELEPQHFQLPSTRAENRNLRQLLTNAQLAAVDLSTERDRAWDSQGELLGDLGALEQELAALRASQEELFAKMRSRTQDHIGALERALKFTGLNVDDMIERLGGGTGVGVGGAGGPYIPALPEQLREDAVWAEAVDLVSLAGRAADLRDVANTLPIALPLGSDAVVSSGFGWRRDPFTGRQALHKGMDFAGPKRMPILAGGPGEVTFASRKGAFGNMVEIDHGLGLTTRYAHLHRISVRVGDRVDMGDPIGQMGSTGRSTAPHLHYEVRLNNVALNPYRFLKAGRHVYQIQPSED